MVVRHPKNTVSPSPTTHLEFLTFLGVALEVIRVDHHDRLVLPLQVVAQPVVRHAAEPPGAEDASVQGASDELLARPGGVVEVPAVRQGQRLRVLDLYKKGAGRGRGSG